MGRDAMPTIDEALQIGWKQHQAGNLRGAEDVYRQVLMAAPGNENAWCFLGMACHDQGRFEEAASAYREALRIKPNFPVALSNFGNTLKQQGKLEEAEASCREALQFKPDYSTAYNNLGVVLVAQGKLEDAAATFEKALSFMPNDVVANANLGAALVRQGRFDEGTEIAQRALKINPNYAEAHKNQAIVWLLLGDFERGWPEYEWRWRCPGSALPDVVGPRWDGSPVAGRTILLHWEQGLGDTVHFIRYAQLFQQQGARVVVCCQKPLKKLLEWCDGIDDLVAAGEKLPPFDFWSPLLSIPGILQTTLATIPANTGYIVADSRLVKKWRKRLANLPGFKIGITWQGSPDFHADRQRSIPLRYFERLARIPGVRLISLQKGFGTDQLPGIAGQFAVIDFGKELDEASGPFLDTAAVMQCIDLVVTSDTCLPHLAGAMEIPTWVALSVSPDWRWLLDRDDCPWYPTMRLFRQRTLGDWEEVFERIAQGIVSRIETQQEIRGDSNRRRPMSSVQNIQVEVAPGELIDKITILEIKSERITDREKLKNVRLELATLVACRDQVIESSPELATLTLDLKQVNESLWQIEDEIRECERQKDFGDRFIELARSVYKSNDRRSLLKRQINELLGSRLVEEKSYAAY
jgi:Tfp pilus assembly protein PilF